MRPKVSFLVDNRCDATAVGLIVDWVDGCVSVTNIQTKVIRADVHWWFYEQTHPVKWLTIEGIRYAGLHSSDSALAYSIEHIRQLYVSPWDYTQTAICGGKVGFNGKWCALCIFNDKRMRRTGEPVDCVLDERCYGGCCMEYQAAKGMYDVLYRFDYSYSSELEYKDRLKALLSKLVMAQIDGAMVLVLVADCWETVYKMRTSAYVKSVEDKLHICGVSLSEADKAITVLPRFTVYAPNPEFKDTLLFGITEALTDGNSSNDPTADDSPNRECEAERDGEQPAKVE